MEKEKAITYKVFIERYAQKQIEKIEKRFAQKITQAIAVLSQNPRPHGYIQLKGRKAFRIRVADYRIIYEINDDKLTVLVVEVGNRREVYR